MSNLKLFYRRGARAAEWGGLENRCTERYPGFESLPLRHLAELNSEIIDFTYSYETYACGISLLGLKQVG